MANIIGGHSAQKPKGNIVVTSDMGTIERDTLQCVHCGKHWVVKHGSGIVRGWCMKCAGPTCGKPECDECLPMEKRLDLYEKGKLGRL